MAKVLVGRDATAYTIQGGGLDYELSGFNAQNIQNVIAVWKDIEVTFTNDWVEVTPSSGELKEKRRTTYDWKAKLSNVVRSGGSIALDAIMKNDYIYVVFTESATGRTVTLIGGISESNYQRGKDAAGETMDIENIGMYNGGPSIFYP